MTTVAEIESAIERLTMAEVKEVAEWLDEYQASLQASSIMFSQLDAEEGARTSIKRGDIWLGL